MNQTSPIVDFGQWNVEHFRLTVFHSPGVQTSGLWESLMGVRPESIEERPREGLVRQQGEAGDNRLLLVTHAERLDWTFVPNPTVNLGTNITPALTTPVLIDPNQAVHKLQEALDISLRVVKQVQRLAFGALLGQEVANQTDGMSQFSKYLPHMALGEQGVSDFMYRINRRRRSSNVPHAQINRIARWSLEQVITGEVHIGIGPAQVPRLMPPPALPSAPGFINRLLLDINTAPENNAIAAERMPGLLVELINLACKVATEGDIP